MNRKTPEYRAKAKIWRANSREKRKAYMQVWLKEHRLQQMLYTRVKHFRTRIKAVEGYGGHCRCCGEDDPRFLTIDHIKPLRRKNKNEGEKGGYMMYKRLIERGFPPGYQVLCFNCNMAKRDFTECPHHLSVDPVTAMIQQSRIAYYRGLMAKERNEEVPN